MIVARYLAAKSSAAIFNRRGGKLGLIVGTSTRKPTPVRHSPTPITRGLHDHVGPTSGTSKDRAPSAPAVIGTSTAFRAEGAHPRGRGGERHLQVHADAGGADGLLQLVVVVVVDDVQWPPAHRCPLQVGGAPGHPR